MDIRTAIRLRHSTRRYNSEPASPELLARLHSSADRAIQLATPSVRVQLVSGYEQVARVMTRYPGGYGLVQGAPHLLIGLLPEDTPPIYLNLGYVLEQVVLEATRLKLSTCWITGTYHPDQAASEVDLREGETVGAVVTVGMARQDRRARLHDQAIRRLVSAHRRIPLERLVFLEQWGNPVGMQEIAPTLLECLECARLAPSAKNLQPWRFVIEGQAIHLALVKPAPIDGGIAMAHIALAAAEMENRGRWTVRWGDPALAASLNLPPAAVPVGTFHL